jgi:hypothetical protein
VIDARGDSADVQARTDTYSLVADAKAFRLSRTAKNQKDFKVQAMDGWRTGLDYAVIVCPIYQLPTRTSQIYQQAIARNVCILSYSHLAALVGLAMRQGSLRAAAGLHEMLKSVKSILHPSKSAVDYWTGINRALLSSLSPHTDLWTIEKTASIKSLAAAKNESLRYLRLERDRLLGLSHQQALEELIRHVWAGFAHQACRADRTWFSSRSVGARQDVFSGLSDMHGRDHCRKSACRIKRTSDPERHSLRHRRR